MELDDLRLLPAGAAILGATLIWPGGTGEIQEQSLGATELETLSELLRGARPGAAGDCPYGGQLTVRLDGESLRLARPLDGCGTLIADDGAVFVLEPGSEAAFWTLFDEAAENLRLQREG